MFAVIFICGKIAKIKTHKNFVIHACCLRDLLKRIIFSKDA